MSFEQVKKVAAEFALDKAIDLCAGSGKIYFLYWILPNGWLPARTQGDCSIPATTF